MCQGDAMDCLSDGRDNARKYFEKLAAAHPDQPLFTQIAERFGVVAANACKMYETLGGWQRGEPQLKALAQPDVRRQLCALIDACKEADQQALELLRALQKAL